MIPDRAEGERRMQYRSQMKNLSLLNDAGIMARAISITQDTLEELAPMQPPNLDQMIHRLERLPLRVGDQADSIGKAVDTLTGSWQHDKRRCKMILSEWDLGSLSR